MPNTEVKGAAKPLEAVRLSEGMINELRQSFALHDYDFDGKIYAHDIGVVTRCVRGLKPSEREVRDMVTEAEHNYSGMVDVKELVQLVSKYVTSPEPDTVEGMAEMFRMYDRDGRGQISVTEMRHVLTSIGEKMTDFEVDQVLKVSGALDNNNMVNYQKFCKVIMEN